MRRIEESLRSYGKRLHRASTAKEIAIKSDLTLDHNERVGEIQIKVFRSPKLILLEDLLSSVNKDWRKSALGTMLHMYQANAYVRVIVAPIVMSIDVTLHEPKRFIKEPTLWVDLGLDLDLTLREAVNYMYSMSLHRWLSRAINHAGLVKKVLELNGMPGDLAKAIVTGLRIVGSLPLETAV